MEKTQPKPLKPERVALSPADLAAGRYGTYEMARIWSPEQTFAYALKVQGEAALTLSALYPKMLPKEIAEEIAEKQVFSILIQAIFEISKRKLGMML